jgi:hypothetical protein
VELQLALARVDHEGLRGGAPGKDELEIPVLHGDVAETELHEAWKGGAARKHGGIREPPDAEIEALDGCEAEDRGEEREVLE